MSTNGRTRCGCGVFQLVLLSLFALLSPSYVPTFAWAIPLSMCLVLSVLCTPGVLHYLLPDYLVGLDSDKQIDRYQLILADNPVLFLLLVSVELGNSSLDGTPSATATFAFVCYCRCRRHHVMAVQFRWLFLTAFISLKEESEVLKKKRTSVTGLARGITCCYRTYLPTWLPACLPSWLGVGTAIDWSNRRVLSSCVW